MRLDEGRLFIALSEAIYDEIGYVPVDMRERIARHIVNRYTVVSEPEPPGVPPDFFKGLDQAGHARV